MKMPYRVSIIVPVYNAEIFIGDTYHSVLKQTYLHWQLIFVDDCSSDHSKKIIEGYAAEDERVVALSTEQNGGPARARNIGIQYALEHNADYLAFLDSDDQYEPNFLKLMLNKATATKADIVWCNNYEYNCGNITTKYIVDHGLGESIISREKDSLNLFLIDIKGIGSLCNKLYSAPFLKRHKITINEERVRAEDWEFNLMLFEKSPRICTIPDTLYNYVHQERLSVMATFREKDFIMYKRSISLLKEMKMKYSLQADDRKLYSNFLYNSICYLVLAISTRQDNAIVKAVVEDGFFRNILNDATYYYRLTFKYKFYAYLIRYRAYGLLNVLVKRFR